MSIVITGMTLKIQGTIGPLTNPTISVTAGTINPNTFTIRMNGNVASSGGVTGTVRDLTLSSQGVVKGWVDTPLTGPVFVDTTISVTQAQEVISSVIKSFATFSTSSHSAIALLLSLLSKQDIENYYLIILNVLRDGAVQAILSEWLSATFTEKVLENSALRSLFSDRVPGFENLYQSYKSGSLSMREFTDRVLDSYTQQTGSQIVVIAPNSPSGPIYTRAGKYKVIRNNIAPQYH